jgi:transcription-repair coupling factor (superfamily II helicase)
MTIEPFYRPWSSPFLPAVRQWLADKPRKSLINGLAGSGDALLISDLFAASSRPVFVFTESSKRAEILCDECATFLGEENVALFPSRDAVPYNLKSPFGPTVETRFRVLAEFLEGRKKIVIAPHAVLCQKIVPPKTLFNRVVRLKTGGEVPPDTLCRWLAEIGFRRENLVSDLGTFSLRGGIMDIYPFLTDNPVRIEYWDDTIDSIREFDVFSQKSLLSRNSVDIFPMREFCLSDLDCAAALQKMAADALSRGGDPLSVRRFEHQWKATADFEGAEWFMHWFGLQSVSILDYCPPETLIVWDDLIAPPRRIDETVQNYERHLARVPESFAPFVSKPHELLHRQPTIEMRLDAYDTVFCGTVEAPRGCAILRVDFAEQPQLPHDLVSLGAALKTYHDDGFRCVVLSTNMGHAERLQELLADSCPSAEIMLGFLSRGIIIRDQRCLLLSEDQLFDRTGRPVKLKKRRSSAPISGFDALAPQDFVVHEDHGIARFLGVERVQAAGVASDCMVLLFAENARVYVPVGDFHKVQKYLGKESIAPALSRIGTSSWERLKSRTRESLKEMASELIELYAKRQFLEGIAFAADSLWQKEFEDAFVYEETPDQLRATQEVKADMEVKKPMDRLICGDVGFGKTEVAMRAVFKAVMAGYQVAILAPTTILAAQHFATLTERMQPFPVRIAPLSRFLRPREQKTVILKAAAGEVDILVGTHRILSGDVKFKNLGLLIIDEEQRFGVRHKEKLKQFRHTIDVLSLTATPIPRTLHLSLVGARDLSIIATPPRNRLPVETTVAEYHDELVKRAVENELERGGQVYFVNNRIKNLEAVKDRLAQLVPAARVVCAHGQMNEHELEHIMKEFIAGRFDVLLSTVIIENGLDIPNVNTIIINRADAMGLAQLYQLRGRVGRSSEQAYAFLLTPSFKEIREDSLRRLRALEQYTELGSGFQIAMRDLEIRGAGAILGTRQHGFLAAVGFALYCRLLEEAVRAIKGELPVEKKPEIKLEIPLDAYIPNDYISDGAARIEIYQELSSVFAIDTLAAIEKTMVDRFGPLPESVISLLLLVRIKCAAAAAGVSRVTTSDSQELSLCFEGDAVSVNKNVMSFMQASDRQFHVVTDPPQVVLKTRLGSSGKIESAREALFILQKTK